MKFCIAIVALILCISVSDATLDWPTWKEKLTGRKLENIEPFQHDLRKRLGRFGVELPMNVLFRTYAEAFIVPDHPERPVDDYRNYQASAQECAVFLSRFRANLYALTDIHEIIMLDSCLGYVFQSPDHEEDIGKNGILKAQISGFGNDERLKEIFEGTKIHEKDYDTRLEIATFLANWALAKHQFDDVICNTFEIELLNDFVKLDERLPHDDRENDSYMKIIYDLIKKQAMLCFNNEIEQINTIMTQEYQSIGHSPMRFMNKVNPFGQVVREQARTRVWIGEVWKLLSGLQGAAKPEEREINIREFARNLRQIKLGNQAFADKFLRNVGMMATRYVNPKRSTELKGKGRGKSDDKPDPNGYNRYTKFVDDVCAFFRKSSDETAVDLYTPYVAMIELTKHPELFGIDEKLFIDRVLVRGKLTGPTYEAVVACSYMSVTTGTFDSHVGGTKQPEYKVIFFQDFSNLQDWPILEWD